ncbi:hypothetical protein [Agrobacterium pusense]|uniref:Uncharacterized protein n=1 Tax=Agrobacterium pusense TaxID=648995 RepID=A0AA44EF37_9HYPH|nr:hypothetical protein [Agrobacterium pusense]NRF17566.1 hypothetical protein [Agrobacterium pusense]
MMVRFENRIARLVVVFTMALCVVLFAFSGPASDHAPRLHMLENAEASSVIQDHDDAGHSHDQLAGMSGDQQPASHHHGDHSHEKAGFLSLPGFSHYARQEAVFTDPVKDLRGGVSDGIDRPPRSAFRI